jgi:Uma2 family endonuclease
MVHLILPEKDDEQIQIAFPASPRMTADEFYDLCQANPDLWFELTREGKVIVMPPAGSEAGYRSGEVSRRLGNWAEVQGGRVFDSSAGFQLPDGSIRAPDACWISDERLAPLTRAQKSKFIPLAPDFIVEVMSPSDRLADARNKMEDWMRNGVALGWLINPYQREVHVYRPGASDPEVLHGPDSVGGEGPVEGFVLHCQPIWDGLS